MVYRIRRVIKHRMLATKVESFKQQLSSIFYQSLKKFSKIEARIFRT